MVKKKLIPLIILAEILCSGGFIIAFDLANFLLFLLISLICGALILALSWRNILNAQLGAAGALNKLSFAVAGLLLIIPGVFSSAIGLVLLIISLVFTPALKEKIYRARAAKNARSEEVIDVELIEEPRKKRPRK